MSEVGCLGDFHLTERKLEQGKVAQPDAGEGRAGSGERSGAERAREGRKVEGDGDGDGAKLGETERERERGLRCEDREGGGEGGNRKAGGGKGRRGRADKGRKARAVGGLGATDWAGATARNTATREKRGCGGSARPAKRDVAAPASNATNRLDARRPGRRQGGCTTTAMASAAMRTVVTATRSGHGRAGGGPARGKRQAASSK